MPHARTNCVILTGCDVFGERNCVFSSANSIEQPRSISLWSTGTNYDDEIQPPLMHLVGERSPHALSQMHSLPNGSAKALPSGGQQESEYQRRVFFKCILHVLFPGVALTLQEEPSVRIHAAPWQFTSWCRPWGLISKAPLPITRLHVCTAVPALWAEDYHLHGGKYHSVLCQPALTVEPATVTTLYNCRRSHSQITSCLWPGYILHITYI